MPSEYSWSLTFGSRDYAEGTVMQNPGRVVDFFLMFPCQSESMALTEGVEDAYRKALPSAVSQRVLILSLKQP